MMIKMIINKIKSDLKELESYVKESSINTETLFYRMRQTIDTLIGVIERKSDEEWKPVDPEDQLRDSKENEFTIDPDFGKTPTSEQVNHPDHYNAHPSGIECIDIVRHHNFNIGSAIKYLWRQGLKKDNSSIQDLKKAIWYIEDQIKKQEK
jgi:hypothetical protein